MSSTQDWLITLNKRVWEAQRNVQEKLENVQSLKRESRGDLQQQIQDKSEELARLRDERNRAEDVTNAWERLAQNAVKEVRKRTLSRKRLEAKLADVKRADTKLAADMRAANDLLENTLAKMDAVRPDQAGSGGKGPRREAVAEYARLEANLQDVRRQKAEKIAIMLHLANERVIPALTLAASAGLPLKLKLDLKEIQSIIEQKSHLRAKLQDKGVEPERATTMSDREVRVHCSQRLSAAIQARLDEQRTLAEQAQQRKAAASEQAAAAAATTTESHRREVHQTNPRPEQQENQRENCRRPSDAPNAESPYSEGYDDASLSVEESYRGRRRPVDSNERGRSAVRTAGDTNRSWISNNSPRTNDEVDQYDSRGDPQSGPSEESHGPYRHQPQTIRDTHHVEYHVESDRYTGYRQYRSRDRPERRDESPAGYQRSRRSPGDRSNFSTYEDSRSGSPVEMDRASPLSIGRVDLGEPEHSDIFGNSSTQDQGFSENIDHDRLF